jgi:hypothetical protein
MVVTNAGQVAAPASHVGVTARARAWLRSTGGRQARPGRTSAATAVGAPIGPAERVLFMDHDLQGSLLAATRAALYHQDGRGANRPWSRLGWEDVGRVGWDDRRHVLTLTGVGPGGIWRKDLALPAHTALVELARERVTSALLASTAVRDGDRVCARVTARRQPGSGTVVWVIVLNDAADTGTPAIQAKVDAAIADVQAQTGIPAAETADMEWPT